MLCTESASNYYFTSGQKEQSKFKKNNHKIHSQYSLFDKTLSSTAFF